MNIVFYIIFGFLFWELMHMTVWEFAKRKFNLDEKKITAIFIFIGIAIALSIVGSGFYRVQTQENIVLTKITGEKEIVKNVGIHYSFLGDAEPIDLRKQIMSYPDFETTIITTKDNKAIRVSGICEYRIINPEIWAIKNKDSKNKLYFYLNSLIIDKIKSNTYQDILIKKEIFENQIEAKLKEIQETYGIEIINFYFRRTLDSIDVITAKSNAEADKIRSESLIKSSESESEALKIKYSSIQDKDFIKYMELMSAIKEGKVNTIFIPKNLNPTINVHE